MVKVSFFSFAALFLASCNGFLVPSCLEPRQHVTVSLAAALGKPSGDLATRRDIFQFATAACCAAPVLLAPQASFAVTGPNDGNLADLPPEAVRSYLQYRMPLQTSADYYVFELQDKIKDSDDWGDIGELFSAKNNRGQGQPSRIEREYVNPMRILGLSMPPDIADRMRESQFKFEKAMAMITKATAGIRRDLPIEIDKSAVAVAQTGWEEGRVALNEFFDTLNEATGLSEMKVIPPAGPNQIKEYGRSQRRYLELMKVTKLCQNRGGPTLSQAWGQLMVTGTVQDSCGISAALEDYFYQ